MGKTKISIKTKQLLAILYKFIMKPDRKYKNKNKSKRLKKIQQRQFYVLS